MLYLCQLNMTCLLTMSSELCCVNTHNKHVMFVPMPLTRHGTMQIRQGNMNRNP